MESIKMNAIKQEAKKLIDNIPDNEITSWDDVMYEFYKMLF